MPRCLMPAQPSASQVPSVTGRPPDGRADVLRRGHYEAVLPEAVPFPASDQSVGHPVQGPWTPIDQLMPPEGVLVETDFPNGRRALLKWKGRLWRWADDSPSRFHGPLYWRPVAGQPAGRPAPAVPAARGISPELLRLLRWAAGAGGLGVAA